MNDTLDATATPVTRRKLSYQVWHIRLPHNTVLNFGTPQQGTVAMAHRDTCSTLRSVDPAHLEPISPSFVLALWDDVAMKPLGDDGYPPRAINRFGMCAFCLIHRNRTEVSL